MESFQPGLSFSQVKPAEIASRLHEQFEHELCLVRTNPRACSHYIVRSISNRSGTKHRLPSVNCR
jgi:hypothetical protein